jgi:crotonobetainyl-CoA:carnitine CoA-transferase CaiB-like acyl-CoA transferase
MSLTGDLDGPPMKAGVAIVDVLTGLHATIGVLVALVERKRSGRGQFVEVNLMSSALSSLVNQASSFLTTGTVPHRISNQHPSIAPYETFATATTPIVVEVGSFASSVALSGLQKWPTTHGG